MGDWEFIKWNLRGLNFRPKVLGYTLILFGSCILIFGWWGIIIALALDWLNHLQGGPMMGYYTDRKSPLNKCSAEIKDCKLCNNEYSHGFNVEYEKKRKWWDIF